MDIKNIRHIVKLALKEDIGKKDITSESVLGNVDVKAAIVSKDEGVIAGLDVAKTAFQVAAGNVKFRKLAKDGERIRSNQVLAIIDGKAKDILPAERTALNFLSHLSGIATLTSKYVEKVKTFNCKILDTRKTTPLLREMEKHAVKMGGGYNHRKGLDDMVLIKDNHLKLISSREIKKVIGAARKRIPKGAKIEVEINTLDALKIIYDCGVDLIMLDNMSPADMRKAVDWVKIQNSKIKAKKTILEASGKINLSNIRETAKTGVDLISVGEITHSAPALDASLEIIKVNNC